MDRLQHQSEHSLMFTQFQEDEVEEGDSGHQGAERAGEGCAGGQGEPDGGRGLRRAAGQRVTPPPPPLTKLTSPELKNKVAEESGFSQAVAVLVW